MGEQKDEHGNVQLAVAVNDIEWIKKGIETLQTTMSNHIEQQDKRAQLFATKEEVKEVAHDVKSLKKWVYTVTGGAVVIVFLITTVSHMVHFTAGG